MDFNQDQNRGEHDEGPSGSYRYEILDSSGQPLRPRRRRPSSPVSFAIMAVCFLVFVGFNMAAPNSIVFLTLSPANGLLFPGILTHMFAHGGPDHLLMNMLLLFFLGVFIEYRYGPYKFAILYFGSGLIAALAQAAAEPSAFLLGASGALAGVMAAFLRHYPNQRLYLWFVLPVPAWLAIGGWVAFNMFMAKSGGDSNVAFIAHVAGFFAGALISLLLEPPRRRVAR